MGIQKETKRETTVTETTIETITEDGSTNVSPNDIQKLLDILNRLVAGGNSVVMIEHNLDVIKCADYIIDIGMEGGAKGGEIIATGTPEEIVEKGVGYTAKYLTEKLK